MQELASGMRNFCLSSLEMQLIPALTVSPIKDVPDASIHLTHSFAVSAFFMEISFTTIGFENGQNLKQIFEKNA